MTRLELNIELDEVRSVTDLAEAIHGVADEIASRDKLPEDEAGNIDTPDGKIVGFWETID